MSTTKAVIKDEAPDYHWWTRLPNIVLSRVDDPYELALLFVIRKVAGDDPEDGVCYMNLQSLAALAKMNVKTARKKIHTLDEKGLIRAELKPGPRNFRVWHITVPRSLWEENEEAYRQLRDATEPIVPETEVIPTTLGRFETTKSGSHTKNLSTKNLSTKKVDIHEKDEHGKYVDRSPQKKCAECGQYLRGCICEKEPAETV